MPSTKSRAARIEARKTAVAIQQEIKPLQLRGGELSDITDDYFPTFESMQLEPCLLKGIQKEGYAAPTPIQRGCIAIAMQGKDLIASALTGTGKTAAFVLPMLHWLIRYKEKKNMSSTFFPATRCLILTPTRELTAQISQNIKSLSHFAKDPITCAVIYGGGSEKPQLAALQNKVDILVACPGRLLDLIRKNVKLKFITQLVLDEADKMLDMGFLDDIKKIMEHLNSFKEKKRQSSLFAATIGRVEELCSLVVSDTAVVVRLQSKYKPKLPENMTHALCKLPDAWDSKLRFIEAFIKSPQSGVGSAVVFVQEKGNCEKVAKFLQGRGILAEYIHSGRSQAQRTSAVDSFKTGTHRVMVATNILSRGIDVPALTHVFNFDVPKTAEDYVHRVGRTARADRSGHAVTLMCGIEHERVLDIECSIGFPLPVLRLQDYVGETKGQLKKRRRQERKLEEGEHSTEEKTAPASKVSKTKEDSKVVVVVSPSREETKVDASKPTSIQPKLPPGQIPIWVSSEPSRAKNRANKRRKERKIKSRKLSEEAAEAP